MSDFKGLDDLSSYCDFLSSQYHQAPKKISAVLNCDISVDESAISSSYDEYQTYVKYFSNKVESSNPDHYKRSGALLLALSNHDIISGLSYPDVSCVEEMDEPFTPLGMSYGDKEHVKPYLKLFSEFPNQVMSFHISYRMMCLYEKNAKNLAYTAEYYENVCALLRKDKFAGMHRIITPDSAFLIFKSLAQ
ncbi:hypothetical protein NKW54_04510 [Acetobacter cerevisiae]|uniref:Uncharacterized protein n=1 Tax=Acetobacter cerevisiae TaxID=178900 RepID=A0ABT1ES11_9PROT|nr:hypothetical protein [Acetobacter cerevisiae]MCP1245199.1 hypothetical protein [Acetobacter cerevisiae]MCP1254574.1 hypothetical protein [Acetobacter cerevisiae]